ncbi:MAG: hypothetical protein ACRC2R_04055 [Xenococcaceae cyanobacterium]
MSIPKKGTRKITVEGESFIWLIRRQATNAQVDYLEGCIHVAVEHSDKPGSVLVIVTDRLHPQIHNLVHSEFVPVQPQDESKKIRVWRSEKNHSTTITPVTPLDVKLWIKQAMQLGWLPKKSGITFKVKVVGECLKKAKL